jgi:tRNA threonylcarbamoyladenosine biosynthesis protein TsaB
MTHVNILALDTATEACSASLAVNEQRFSDLEVCPQQHSQKALPMVESLFEQANAKLKDVDYLVYGQGPGSFTGVRIACGMIQGLSLGTKIPVIGISTLAAMAWQTDGTKVAVAIDARMSEVYYAAFEKQENGLVVVTDECVIPPSEAAELVRQFGPDAIAGTGWAAYPELTASCADLDVEVLYPKAEAMLDLALININNAGDTPIGVPANKVEPVYLRDKVTWKKLPGKE